MSEEEIGIEDASQDTLSTGTDNLSETVPTGDAETGDAATSDNGEEKKFSLDDLYHETGIKDPDELKSTLSYLDDIKGKLAGEDLETVLKQAKTLREYEERWAAEDERKKREEQTPEETIEYLEEKLKEVTSAQQTRAQREAEENKRQEAMGKYDSEVSKALDLAKDLDPIVKDFLGKTLSSNYESNTINPSDLRAVRNMVANEAKAVDAFKRDIIKQYVAGKIEMPDIAPTAPSAPAASKGPKTIKEAAAIAKQMFKEGRIFQT